MHGRESEERKRRHHMLTVPSLDKIVGHNSTTLFAADFFCKDGRKISVGDCALFKPLQDPSPPFIGIIRWLKSGKENYLKLGVNWLYRPAEIKLGKGVLLKATPNEIFYSFHQDEIPAASLLHLCKVSFLRKGVELPLGISSFVCRRVYDVTNKCLWWLTDKDFVNERQEEVNQLLDKTQLEMRAVLQSGGRSPKPLNGPTTTQLKPGSDSVQNSVIPFPSQIKGKKRERCDQGFEPIKRERHLKTDDGDFCHFRLESILKSEISKITEKGGLVDGEGVEKLVQLMQPDRAEKSIDLAGRIMLADVITATDRFECLEKFVQLRGLSILDEWLQEVHKGKISDSSSPKEGDKSVEEFLSALLRALDRLPVNLQALQTCNVGKSVNHLRSHKNLEIQKKVRSLVDRWKKRVEAEMEINDVEPGSSQAVSWPSKSGFSDGSHAGNKRIVASSEVPMKSSITQPSTNKAAPVKKHLSTSPGCMKSPKDSHEKMAVSSGTSDMPLTMEEEKSSSSSLSQNNSQSCSSDRVKTRGSTWKQDSRRSNTGSRDVNKTSSGVSRHRRSSNIILGSAVSGAQKETSLKTSSPLNRKATSEKVSQTGLTCKATSDIPVVDHVNSHRLIVRLPNPGRSPARIASGGSFDDPSVMVSRASSTGHSEKHDQYDRTGSDDDGSPAVTALDKECCRNGDGTGKPLETSIATRSSSENDKVVSSIEPKSSKLYDTTLSSMSVLIESCEKHSEADACVIAGDDLGMNLLASVAAGEMSKSDLISPTVHDLKSRLSCEDVSARNQGQSDDGPFKDAEKLDNIVGPSHITDGLLHITNFSGDNETTRSFSEDKPKVEHSEQFYTSRMNLQKSTDPCSKSDVNPDETTGVSAAMSSNDNKKVGQADEDKKVGHADEKTPEGNKTMVSNFVHCSMSDGCNIDIPASNVRDEKETFEESQTCPSLEMEGEKKDVHEGLNHAKAGEDSGSNTVVASGSDSVLNPDCVVGLMPEKAVVSGVSSVVLDHGNGDVKDISERKMPFEHDSGGSAPREQSPTIPMQEPEQYMKSSRCKLPGVDADETEECASTANEVSSLPVVGGLDITAKLDFDLNEGFCMDEDNTAPGCSSSVHIPSPLPLPVSSMSSGLPGSITVAAAAKGPFVPPENLLKTKGELGWKGSAATSAFRPAEPRKVLDMPSSTTDIPIPDTVASKEVRLPLDIDLNVTDERVHEDMVSHCSTQETSSPSGFIGHRDLGRVEPVRSTAGLDLDLNRVDEDTDIGQFPVSNIRRLEVPLLPVRLSSSRDFDLNNGPGLGEIGAEPILQSQHAKSSIPYRPPVPGPRLSNAELGSPSSWFPHGNSVYPASAIPSILPDRGEQPYPTLVTAGLQQRILGSPNGGMTFSQEIYRGSVLSSSPALAFSPATSFPYPGFAFTSSFPIPSTSFSIGPTAYIDASSGSGLCFPTVPSQLVGSIGAVPSHYPRPYVISVPDGSVESSRKLGRQGLDLNAGPGGTDMDGRDERFPKFASRNLSVAGSSALAEEQLRMYQAAGGVMKRR